MQISVLNVETLSGDPMICVSHHDQEVFFSVSYYGRNSFNSGVDLFEQLNLYWKNLPMQKQDRIFNIYQMLKFHLESFFAQHIDLVKALRETANELFDAHDFNDLRMFVFHKTDLNIPDNLDESFIYDVDRQNTPEQTYLRHEYVDLVTMTLIFRTLMPVWGEYISMMKREHGNYLKEYNAYDIIRGTNITNHIAFKKLEVYVDKTIGIDRYNSSAIMEQGLSSEDFPEVVLSRVIVRRLCVSDIRGKESKANVVTFIHKYVDSNARPNQMSIEDRIEDKSKDVWQVAGDSPDDKLSSFERFRVKHTISMGELEEIQYSLRDPRATAYKLTGEMTDELLTRSLETSKELFGKQLTNPQISLLQWVFKPIVSPRGIPYIDYGKNIENIGVLEAVLWARGHKYLALLASSYVVPAQDTFIVSSVDTVKRIPAELIAELNTYYPYHKMSGGRKTGYKAMSLVTDSIDGLAGRFSNFTWIPTAHPKMVEEVLGNNSRRIPVPPDIKILIAQLVLEIGKRSWK